MITSPEDVEVLATIQSMWQFGEMTLRELFGNDALMQSSTIRDERNECQSTFIRAHSPIGPFPGLSAEENAELATYVGAIVLQSDCGFVDVDWFTSVDQMVAMWAHLQSEETD